MIFNKFAQTIAVITIFTIAQILLFFLFVYNLRYPHRKVNLYTFIHQSVFTWNTIMLYDIDKIRKTDYHKEELK